MPVKLNSSGGGSVTIDVPSTASAFTLTLPAATGNVITTGASISGGFLITPYNIGTPGSGTTVTPVGTNGNYQYLTNGAAFTIAAPTTDTAIDILVTNSATAGTITLTGFTAPSGGGGDAYATTNTNRYILMIRRINGVATYSWKALQ